MDDLASALAEFEASIDALPAVETDERIKPDWRKAMVAYGSAAVASIANGRAMVVDRQPATPSMMAPMIWCCGRPDKERDIRWVGHSLLAVLVHHESLASATLRWMLDRPEWILRATALETLRSDHPSSLTDELLSQGLDDQHRCVRGMAAHMILDCERRNLLPKLREAASRERLDWLRETMDHTAEIGDVGYVVEPSAAGWVAARVRLNLDGRSQRHWWSAKSADYEHGGLEAILRSHYGRRNPMPQPQPLPSEPPEPIAPWLVYSKRPMGYLFMNRLEGPDVVQVLKGRHGPDGDNTWPPIR